VKVQTDVELDHAVRQFMSRAVDPAGNVDLFEATGFDATDIPILSSDFLTEV